MQASPSFRSIAWGQSLGMEKSDSARSDIVFGAIFLGLAVFTLFMSSQLFERVQAGLSIRTFPNFVGVGMAVLALMLLAKGVRAMREEHGASEHRGASGREAAAERSLRDLFQPSFVLRGLGFAVLGVVYTQVIRQVGYVVATPPLIFCAMLLYGEKKWYRLVLIPIIVTAVLFHLFRTFFRVPLPRAGLW